MSKSMLIGVVAGVGIATAGGVLGYQFLGQPQMAADDSAVVALAEEAPAHTQTQAQAPAAAPRATAAAQPAAAPAEECWDEEVVVTTDPTDKNRIAGTALGAVLGGVLGNQVGGGRGKTLATVAGAAAGGYAGNKTQENMQQGDTYTTTERRCNTVTDKSEKTVGYNVKYKIKDMVDTVRMDHEPGAKIPLDKNGQLVLNEDSGSTQQ